MADGTPTTDEEVTASLDGRFVGVPDREYGNSVEDAGVGCGASGDAVQIGDNCQASLSAGDTVWLYAYWHSLDDERGEWILSDYRCERHALEAIPSPREDTDQVVVQADLAAVGDGAMPMVGPDAQNRDDRTAYRHLELSDVRVVTHSPVAEDGDA